ncbi:MAG: hypothetical protein ABI467_01575 [Kofleriaceae bacterium]
MDWLIYGILGAGGAALAGTSMLRRTRHDAFAHASELAPVADLSHLPASLQRTALWSLAEGGFERRAVHGVVKRPDAPTPGDVAVTAFDLETLRSRRGEWAYLPVEPPFRIGDVVSVVVCELDRSFPHVLLKRTGRGDKLHDDALGEISTSLTRLAHEALRAGRHHAAELPASLASEPLTVELPEHWRAYGREIEPLLRNTELRDALARTQRRDLVIEVIDSLLIVYPAARAIAGADPFADLVSSALVLVDAIRASVVSPRGIENH